jgi:hypothetical protein
VSGIVVPDVVVDPARLDFGGVGAGSAPSRLAMLQNMRPEHPVHVTAVELDERIGKAEVEALQEGVRYRVRAKLASGLPRGPFNAVIRVHTDHPQHATIELPIDGTVDAGMNDSKAQVPNPNG